MEPTQLNLFSNLPRHPKSPSRQEQLVMSADALLVWKAKIANYQQQVKASLLAKQDTLFDLAGLGISPAHVDPDTIDPFSLLLQPMSFWRWPVDSPGDSCIYIVIDIAVPLTTKSCSTDTNTPTGKLVLYIGETCRSNHRWKDNHGCKEYLSKYQDLHYRYGMKTGVGIGFWWNTPVQRKPRQQLELAL
ncbi:MAG TPA: hypothetical protein DCE56_33480, partial [Cyanobacteria bacterium UBA8553]|nr:hypothetical protein [Cyanobacteria bacterium UBA8553]